MVNLRHTLLGSPAVLHGEGSCLLHSLVLIFIQLIRVVLLGVDIQALPVQVEAAVTQTQGLLPLEHWECTAELTHPRRVTWQYPGQHSASWDRSSYHSQVRAPGGQARSPKTHLDRSLCADTLPFQGLKVAQITGDP